MKHGSTTTIRIETTSKTLGMTRWNCTEASKDTTIGWKGYGFWFLRFSGQRTVRPFRQRGLIGILFIDYLEKGKKTNSDYYCALLDWLKEEITRKGPRLLKKKCIFLQDNGPARKSIKAMAKIIELGFELLPDSPCSSDLAPSDFFLFPNLMRWLQGQRFSSNEKVKWKPMATLEALTNDMTREASKCWKVVGLSLSSWKEIMLKSK